MANYRKLAAVLLIVICAAFVGYGQGSTTKSGTGAKELPPLLRPSEYAADRAIEMGSEVFKLLPYGPNTRSSDGAYYSFTNRSHSPYQLFLTKGELTTGAGWDYGFFAELGQIDLRDVDNLSPAAEYFLAYRPPKLTHEVGIEIDRLKNLQIGGMQLTRRVKPRVGHTYLLRSITFFFSDIVIALNVLEISPDGALTIVWKKLAEFERPRRLFMSDSELRIKVTAVLTALAFQDVGFNVKENYLTFTGPEMRFTEIEAELRQQGIRHCGITHGKQSTLKYC